MRPSEAREVWHPLHSTVAALGGRGPGQVDGEICTTCHAERERVGMTGPTLIDRLVMRAAGIEGKLGADQLLLNQVPAFAVTGRTKPNSSPWSHINLKQLKSDFEGGRL